jgi:hypothetical protein
VTQLRPWCLRGCCAAEGGGDAERSPHDRRPWTSLTGSSPPASPLLLGSPIVPGGLAGARSAARLRRTATPAPAHCYAGHWQSLPFAGCGGRLAAGGEYWLFDPAAAGAGVDDCLKVSLQAGRHALETALFSPDRALCVLVHRLRGERGGGTASWERRHCRDEAGQTRAADVHSLGVMGCEGGRSLGERAGKGGAPGAQAAAVRRPAQET